MNKLDIFTNLAVDGMEIADKKDIFKDFFNGSDEFLSSSSWGNLIKFCAKKSIEISDINEAYYFTVFTAYLNTFKKALYYYGIKENNFSIPKYNIKYNYKELDINSISSNKLVNDFHSIFKKFIDKNAQNKVIKYITNNIKLNFYKVIEDNPLVLDKYIKYMNSDIFKIEQNDFQKELYNIAIEQEYKDIVLADEKGLTLEDLYVEPYFRVFQKHFTKDDERYENKSYQSKYCDVKNISLHAFITDTLNGENNLNLIMENVNTIFISGYPGQGKSSFTKRFIYDILNDKIDLKYDVILIKLKNIEDPSDFLNKDLQTIIKENIPFEIDSLDNYIVVLDGLDELVMKSSISIQDSNSICEKISRSKIKTIVTTRHSYVDFEKLYEKNILTLELKELNQEQQILWLKKYSNSHKDIKLTKEVINKLHENENNHILELINQPILLHMIADMNIDNIETLDKSSLYKKFFDILINRKWEKDKHTLLEGIDEDSAKLALRNMLQELSHTIFTSEYAYIHKIDFEKLETVKDFQELLVTQNNESLEENLKGVMVSFYFKEVKKENTDIRIEEQNENYAIEFLHKSLMEYMVAEYIWEKVQDLLVKKKYNKFAFDEKQALELFWSIFNKKILSNEVVGNLIEILKNENQDRNDELALRFDSYIEYFLDKDFIYHSSIEEYNLIEKSIAVFYGFWTILSYLDNKNHIMETCKAKIIKLFKILRVYYHDSALNLANSDFTVVNFSGIDFENTNLSNCNFTSAKLNNITTVNTLLKNTKFSNTQILYSDLWDFDLSNSDINLIRLDNSSINNSTFENVNISDSDFSYVKFSGCCMYNSSFYDVDFTYSIFSNSGGDRTILQNINFIDSYFKDTIFKRVEFINCPKIHFEDLKKQGAIFIDCTNDGKTI